VKFPLVIVAASSMVLVGCGGESDPNGSPESSFPSLDVHYKLSDFSNAHVSTENLTGTWVAITDETGAATIDGFDVSARSNEISFFVIRNNPETDQLEINNCSAYMYIRDSSDNIDNSITSISFPEAGTGFTDIDLDPDGSFEDGLLRTIIPNVDNNGFTVDPSSLPSVAGYTFDVAGIKISDDTGSLGTMSAALDDDDAFDENIYCMARENVRIIASQGGLNFTSNEFNISTGFETSDGAFEVTWSDIDDESDHEIIVETEGFLFDEFNTEDDQDLSLTLTVDNETQFTYELDFKAVDTSFNEEVSGTISLAIPEN